MADFTATVVAPGITRITDVGQVYMYLIEGTERALLVDTGYGYGDLPAFVQTLTDLPLDVVCTHGHVDHVGGAYGFEQVWLNEADWELAKEHSLPETRIAYLQNIGTFDYEKLLPARCTPWEPLHEGHEFRLGGCTVTAIPLSGHTAGMMAMLIEPQQIMLLGDGCNSAAFLFFKESGTVEQYYKSLLELRAWDEKYHTVLFSHSHNYGGKEILEQSITLCEAILDGTDDKMPIDTYAPQIVYAGKKLLPDFTNEDGTCANIWYDPACIR